MVYLETAIKTALENNEFQLYYQPKVDLVSGEIVEMEALIRWNHPEKGMISPVDFIPVAEDTGLILPIGEWVLRTACKQNKIWHDSGLSSLIMAVNLSTHQLYQPNLIHMIQEILEEVELAPEFLELEISESMVMDVQYVLPIIKDLKALGIRLSLDDFGIGYSSLYYLKEFPIDIIKIDQSFVRNCILKKKDATIVKTIIAMAHQLKLDIVAEGVETKEQMVFLQRYHCNKAQGYLFSQPAPPEELIPKFHVIKQIIREEGIAQEITWQQQLETSIDDGFDLFRRIVEKLPEGIVVHLNDTILYTNPAAKKISKEHTMVENPIYQEIFKKRMFQTEGEHCETPVVELQMFNADGEVLDIEAYSKTINFHENPAFLTVIRDITERRKIKKTLKQNEERYRLITENIEDLVCIINTKGFLEYASPSHENLLGFPVAVYEGQNVQDLIHKEDIPHIMHVFNVTIKSQEGYNFEFRLRNIVGVWVWLEAKLTPVFEESGDFKYFLMVSREITKKKKYEEQLTHMAFHDILTDLPNRRLFKDRLKKSIKNAKRHGNKIGLMFMDIDRFKYINDKWGHDVGDELLKQFSYRVKKCLREMDILSRHGGDEFALFLPTIKEEKEAFLIAKRILTELQKPWKIGAHEFHTTSSIGIAFYPMDGITVHELMKHADRALYHAKESGRNNIKQFIKGC